MRDYIFMYHCDDLVPLRYKNSYSQSDRVSYKSTSSFVFTLSGKATSWRSMKQSCIFCSTIYIEYVVFEIVKEVVWLRKFLMGL